MTGVRRKPRADDANRRGGARQKHRAACKEGGQDLVAQTRVRGDHAPEGFTRNGQYFAWLRDPSRHEHALTGQEIQLAQEPAGRVAGDDAFPPVGLDDDFDGARKGDVEIVAGVALPIEVFPSRHRPAHAKRPQRRQLRVVQLPESIIGLSQETLPLWPLSVQPRDLCLQTITRLDSVG